MEGKTGEGMSDRWQRVLRGVSTIIHFYIKEGKEFEEFETKTIQFPNADLEAAPVSQISAWDLYAASFIMNRLPDPIPGESGLLEEHLLTEAADFANRMMRTRADVFNAWIERKCSGEKKDA
jgi:hypothetical protein